MNRRHIALAEKVAFLSSPRSYPHQPDGVQVIETHLSFVFVAGNDVYKFKKPVNYPHLDLRSLADREANCAAEYRLNLRLASETYIGVSRLTISAQGDLALDGDGQTVDWLVHMNRLDQHDFLDVRIQAGTVSQSDVTRIAERLGVFYRDSVSVAEDVELYIAHLDQEQRINRDILAAPRFGLDSCLLSSLADEMETRRPAAHAAIRARAAQGLLREGHGDLRPEHVWLGEPLQIFDALEFNRAMRILDPFDEVNYLGLECALLGAGWIRPSLREKLEQFIPAPPRNLLAYLGAFRCVLRARICVAHLLDEIPMTPERWRPEAETYLRQAARELEVE